MENETKTEIELSTRQQVVGVVLCAIAGYAATQLTAGVFVKGLEKFRTIRANRSE